MATKRSRNVTDAERNILLKLIQPHMSIIENTKTDGTSNKIKLNTWENIRHQYNALQSTGERTTTQLKAMFDTMKRKTRKDKSSDRVNTYIYQPNSTTTERENEVLVDLLLTNKPSIDSSIDNQDEVWKTIAESYNQLQTSGKKTIEELKKCNKRLQKSASLDINKENVSNQTYKTGGGKSEHQSSSISSKVMGMMGNRLESLECPYDCDGDFPGILQTSYEELPGIAKKQSCGSGSPIYYTVGLDAQAVSTSTPCRNVLVKDNIEWLLNSNDSSAKESAMDISIHDNTDQPNKKNDFQTKYKKITAVPSKLHELLPNKKVPVTHTTANKVYESLENISNQRLGLNTTKEKFHEHYNDLKIKKAKIELEIAEIEREMLIEKLKSDKEHYISQYKQDKLREEILEHELNQKKQTL
ncbi:Myb DNA-bind 5 domain-containing protein [Aphis craccivora]|uniref:Regulatory protein zeste n=1 Tax=Aphis craccivora TaxID=307492 RepID=A0A6G0VXV9_APHCR|nr:Myb DNA-bind 5 domain-containing protein [Aphis craccivora]